MILVVFHALDRVGIQSTVKRRDISRFLLERLKKGEVVKRLTKFWVEYVAATTVRELVGQAHSDAVQDGLRLFSREWSVGLLENPESGALRKLASCPNSGYTSSPGSAARKIKDTVLSGEMEKGHMNLLWRN